MNKPTRDVQASKRLEPHQACQASGPAGVRKQPGWLLLCAVGSTLSRRRAMTALTCSFPKIFPMSNRLSSRPATPTEGKNRAGEGDGTPRQPMPTAYLFWKQLALRRAPARPSGFEHGCVASSGRLTAPAAQHHRGLALFLRRSPYFARGVAKNCCSLLEQLLWRVQAKRVAVCQSTPNQNSLSTDVRFLLRSDQHPQIHILGVRPWNWLRRDLV